MGRVCSYEYGVGGVGGEVGEVEFHNSKFVPPCYRPFSHGATASTVAIRAHPRRAIPVGVFSTHCWALLHSLVRFMRGMVRDRNTVLLWWAQVRSLFDTHCVARYFEPG